MKSAETTDQAQRLHLIDQKHIIDADKSVKGLIDYLKEDNQSSEPEEKPKKHWWQWTKK